VLKLIFSSEQEGIRNRTIRQLIIMEGEIRFFKKE